MTFKVVKPDSVAYLLRIHVPLTSARSSHGADPDMVRSELLWLEALCRDADLVWQTPLRNRDGAQITQVSAERQTWGIMHEDAHKGNMLLHDGDIRLNLTVESTSGFSERPIDHASPIKRAL